MTPHKHHDLIVAWAKGAKIQVKSAHLGWQDVLNHNPAWDEDTDYRIKPVPKPDKVILGYVNNCGYVWNPGTGVWYQEIKNLRLTIDGETGKLKEAEVIDEA